MSKDRLIVLEGVQRQEKALGRSGSRKEWGAEYVHFRIYE